MADASRVRALPATWMRSAPRRFQERDFWLIQMGLTLVTLVHVTYEALTAHQDGTLAYGLHHLPAMLYVLPVVYAGTFYRLEGGILTGLAALALTVPNMVFWHRADYEWMEELSFMATLVVIGIGLAVPIARDRRQLRQAERMAGELSLVNAVARAISSARDIQTTVEGALGIVVEALDLDAAAVGLRRPGQPQPAAVASMPGKGTAPARLERIVGSAIRDGTPLGSLDHDGVAEVPISAMGMSGVLVVATPDGRPLRPDDVELLSAVGNQIALAVDNLVVHKDEQDHLRSYVRMATQAQEDERLRIAREIHDETAQLLALIRRGLRDLSKRASPDLVGGPLGLAELTDLSESSLWSLRKFARDLRPATLDNLGLVPALRWLSANLERRSGVTAQITVEGDPRRLSPETEVALFRIVQEALRNVERHADAGSVSLTIRHGSEVVHVEVRDDGRGFTVPSQLTALPMNGRLGLVGMQERARLAGGSIAVKSHQGEGTVVTIELPVPQD